jgi:hypothetical protein
MALTAAKETPTHKKTIQHERMNNILEPRVQGAILLQSLLRLPEPHNQLVIARYFLCDMHLATCSPRAKHSLTIDRRATEDCP